MEEITVTAYGKINIGLDVLRKREDGYHELRTIMQTVSIHDTIRIEKTDADTITMTTNKSGLACDASNLIVRAAELMRTTYHIRSGMKLHLDKNIPMAAGMAGGSADAAAVLRGVNKLFDLQIPIQELSEISVSLGADVPYCVMGGTVLAEGIGEKLTPITDMDPVYVLIAKPGFDVSTRFVFEQLHANELTKHPDTDGMLAAIANHDLTELSQKMGNVLELVTEVSYPQISDIKKSMCQHNALVSMMSGSGPTVFGLFSELSDAQAAAKALKDEQLAVQIEVTKLVNAETNQYC